MQYNLLKSKLNKIKKILTKYLKKKWKRLYNKNNNCYLNAIDKNEDITNLISYDIVNKIYAKTKSTPFIYALLKGNVQAVNVFLAKF